MLKFSEIKNTKWQTTLNSDSVSSGDINMAGRLNWFTMKRLARIGLTTEVNRVILLPKLKCSKRISATHFNGNLQQKSKGKVVDTVYVVITPDNPDYKKFFK